MVNPATQEEYVKGDCAVRWMAELTAVNCKETYSVGGAVEGLRNAVHENTRQTHAQAFSIMDVMLEKVNGSDQKRIDQRPAELPQPPQPD